MPIFKEEVAKHLKDKKLIPLNLPGKDLMALARTTLGKYTHPMMDPYRQEVVKLLAPHEDRKKWDKAADLDKLITAVDEKIQLGLKSVDEAKKKAEAVAKMPHGTIHKDAVKDFVGGNSTLIDHVKRVFDKTAGGKTSPGTTGIRHLHVGSAQLILYYDESTFMILGLVVGHQEGAKSNDQDKVFARKGGTGVKYRIEDSKLVEDK